MKKEREKEDTSVKVKEVSEEKRKNKAKQTHTNDVKDHPNALLTVLCGDFLPAIKTICIEFFSHWVSFLFLFKMIFCWFCFLFYCERSAFWRQNVQIVLKLHLLFFCAFCIWIIRNSFCIFIPINLDFFFVRYCCCCCTLFSGLILFCGLLKI